MDNLKELQKATRGLLTMVSAVLTDSQLDHPQCGETIRRACDPLERLLGETAAPDNGAPSWVCARCGGRHVHTVAWIDANTNEVLDDFGSWGEEDTQYCVDCSEHYRLVSPEDFKANGPCESRSMDEDDD